MAKSKRKEAQPAEPEQPTHRADPERAARIFILGGVGAMLLLVIGLIIGGWYWTQVRPLDKTVLQVGEIKFSLGHLERRMSDELSRIPPTSLTSEFLLVLPDTVLRAFEREAKVLEAAGDLDVTVSELEIDEEIARRGNIAAGAEPGAFAAELKRQVEDSGLKLDEFFQMIKAELLENKVQTHFRDAAADQEPQVRARWIVIRVDDLEAAQELFARLEAGEEFTAVIEDLPDSAASTEEDWVPRGLFPDQAIEDFLFEAQPGQYSEVISTLIGHFIVELEERDDERELDEVQKDRIGTRELLIWLGSLDAIIEIERNITEEERIRALRDIGVIG